VDSSVHIHRISHQPAQFSNYLLAGMQEMITQFMLVVLATLAILFFNVKLFLILLIILLPAIMLSASIVKKKIRDARKHIKVSNEKTQQYLKEALDGYIESNIYDKHDFFKKRYTDAQRELHKYLSDLQITQGVPTRLIEVFAIAGLFLLIALNRIESMVEQQCHRPGNDRRFCSCCL
jgi:ABC-type transport system involved in cytochrome bd biosynthesis fused ATPase/permease subunit